MHIRLPWPPSVNHYWRNVNGRTILSRKGRQYREDVYAVVLTDSIPETCFGRLAVTIEATMPDRRERDIDNLAKAVLDSLQHAGVYVRDSQIDHLTIRRLHVEPPGAVVVTIEEID